MGIKIVSIATHDLKWQYCDMVSKVTDFIVMQRLQNRMSYICWQQNGEEKQTTHYFHLHPYLMCYNNDMKEFLYHSYITSII